MKGTDTMSSSTEETSFTPDPKDLESLARRLYPAIKEYFESEEGQREFEEWKKRKEAERQ